MLYFNETYSFFSNPIIIYDRVVKNNCIINIFFIQNLNLNCLSIYIQNGMKNMQLTVKKHNNKRQ